MNTTVLRLICYIFITSLPKAKSMSQIRLNWKELYAIEYCSQVRRFMLHRGYFQQIIFCDIERQIYRYKCETNFSIQVISFYQIKKQTIQIQYQLFRHIFKYFTPERYFKDQLYPLSTNNLCYPISIILPDKLESIVEQLFVHINEIFASYESQPLKISFALLSIFRLKRGTLHITQIQVMASYLST